MTRAIPVPFPIVRMSRRATVGAGLAAIATAQYSSRSTHISAKEGTSMPEATPATTSSPTVVLVHGAFADASSWSGVIPLLQQAGLTVTAPPNPLRSLASDAAYIASYVSQIPGPVLLVGHSYGGAVITNAGSQVSNAVGLVYVAAFAPEDGETGLDIEQNARDSVLLNALIPFQYPTGSGKETATEYAIDPAKIQEAFAADLSADQNALLAATQRPVAEAALAEPTVNPAWKSLPSWAVVPTGDKAIGSDAVRSMAERAGAAITEVEGSHVIMISQPNAVANVILTAATATSAVGARD